MKENDKNNKFNSKNAFSINIADPNSESSNFHSMTLIVLHGKLFAFSGKSIFELMTGRNN